MTRHPYYNYDKLYSYNGVYNFIAGGRGIGKTFGAKEKGIRAAITKGDQFIYLRRYKTEMQTARNTFFADVEYKFPNHDFKVQGNEAMCAPVKTRGEKKRSWQVIGYFIALSNAQTQKSVAFPRVKLIMFDEFIIEKGALHYLPDESTVFNNFYSTVDRYTDKTKVLFLANSVSIMNPYFIAHEIRPDQDNEFIIKKDGFIVCHFPDSEKFASSVYQTKFGKFIKDTDYADYAVSNAFSDNHDMLLEGKPSNAKYVFSLECRTGSFSIWHTLNDDQYYVQSKLPKQQIMFTLLPEKMDVGKVLMTQSDRPLQYLRSAFKTARLTFDKPATRNVFAEIFK